MTKRTDLLRKLRARTPHTGLGREFYNDADIFESDLELIFYREWLFAAHTAELPKSGSYLTLQVGAYPIVLVRAADGVIRAFVNMCRHRGQRLCPAERGTAHKLVCPYHQWTYDLDGRLLAAPYLTTEAGFDKSAFSLYPIAVETWGGFVFLHLTPATATPFAAQAGGAPERLSRYPLSELRIGHTIEYQVAANWKVICENYNECYHCAGVHPELCAIVPAFKDRGGSNLDWERGIPHREGAYTFTKSGTTRRRPFPTLNEDEQVRHKGELGYPNLFLSVACDHVTAYFLRPVSAGRTDITCHFLFETHEIEKPGFDPSDTVDFWDLVNRQDWTVCESVQDGISARVHAHGYFAPMEDFNLDIRRYVKERIGAYIPTKGIA